MASFHSLTAPRRPFIVAAAVAVAILIANVIVASVNRAWDHHKAAITQRNQRQVMTAASRVVAPVGFTPTHRFSGQPCQIRHDADIGCWRTSATPAQAGPAMRDALSRSGLVVQPTSCRSFPVAYRDNAPIGPPKQFCLVRAVRDGWDITFYAFTRIIASHQPPATRAHPLESLKLDARGTEVVLRVEAE